MRVRGIVILSLMFLVDCSLLTDLSGLQGTASHVTTLADAALDVADASLADGVVDSCDASRFCSCHLGVTFCSDFDDSTLQGAFGTIGPHPSITLELDPVQFRSSPTALRARVSEASTQGIASYLAKETVFAGATSSLLIRYSARIDELGGGSLSAVWVSFPDVDHNFDILWTRISGAEVEPRLMEVSRASADGGGPRQFNETPFPGRVPLGSWNDYAIELAFTGSPRARVFLNGALVVDVALSSNATGTKGEVRAGVPWSTATGSVAIDNLIVDRK